MIESDPAMIEGDPAVIESDRAVIERIARRYEGRWLQGYARGKLRGDPAYRAVAELLKAAPRPVLDLGCGLGLLEFYLREQGFGAPLVGWDFDARKIAQARRIAATVSGSLQFATADLTQPWPEFGRGHVVILDLLHYLPAEAQHMVLTRAAERVPPGALCIIRATPRDASWRFRATQAEEWFIRAISWMKSGAVHFATMEEIAAPFVARGFSLEARPLWGRTPFNSYLLVLRAPFPSAVKADAPS